MQATEDVMHWKYRRLDLSPILYREPDSLYTAFVLFVKRRTTVLKMCWIGNSWKQQRPALENQRESYTEFKIKILTDTVGTILFKRDHKKYRGEGLPAETIHFKFTGTAGQSFAAFNTKGITLELEGDANDYFGKGLSGARLIIYPPKQASL